MKKNILVYSACLGCLTAVYAENPPASSPAQSKEEAAIEIPSAADDKQKCRIGMITVAEISTVKPEIRDWDPSENKLENHVWAEVCINLFPYRGVSRFDFVLAGKYPGIAVAKEKQIYSGKKENWVIAPLAKKDKDKLNPVRLLFAIPEADVKDWTGTRDCTLDFNLNGAKHPSDTISFRILPMNQPLSSSASK